MWMGVALGPRPVSVCGSRGWVTGHGAGTGAPAKPAPPARWRHEQPSRAQHPAPPAASHGQLAGGARGWFGDAAVSRSTEKKNLQRSPQVSTHHQGLGAVGSLCALPALPCAQQLRHSHRRNRGGCSGSSSSSQQRCGHMQTCGSLHARPQAQTGPTSRSKGLSQPCHQTLQTPTRLSPAGNRGTQTSKTTQTSAVRLQRCPEPAASGTA